MATTKTASKSSARTDVKFGISDSSHELNFECSNSQAEVIAKVNDVIKSSSVLSLSDSKGREILVPFNKISYVEVGESADRHVGFANQ